MDAVAASLSHGGEELLLDPLGVVYLPVRGALVVADLHLEKGSAFARQGAFLPPYDTARTIRRLGWAIQRYRPRTVVSLGDAFHDRAGSAALTPEDRERLHNLQTSVTWVWVRGNHDPDPPQGLAGDVVDHLDFGRLRLAHLPDHETEGRALLAGHLHPKARLAQRRRSATRPCFAGDATCLLLPAFGAYTGGLNVLDEAISGLFAAGFRAFMLGESKVFEVAHEHLTPDPPDWRRHRMEAM